MTAPDRVWVTIGPRGVAWDVFDAPPHELAWGFDRRHGATLVEYVRAPQWRSVKDDPPPAWRTYIVCWWDGDVQTAYWNGSLWHDSEGDAITTPPTHWQPLPEPPKETP